MKPADLREFAEKMYLTAPRHAEFAKEILVLIDRDEDSVEEAMIEELEHHCPEGMHGKDPLKMIEYLGDRDNVLAAIEEKISDHEFVMKEWGIAKRPAGNEGDTVVDLFDTLFNMFNILVQMDAWDRVKRQLVYMRANGGRPEASNAAPVVYDL